MEVIMDSYYYCTKCKDLFPSSHKTKTIKHIKCGIDAVRTTVKKDGFYVEASLLNENNKLKEMVKVNAKSSDFIVQGGIVYERTFG